MPDENKTEKLQGKIEKLHGKKSGMMEGIEKNEGLIKKHDADIAVLKNRINKAEVHYSKSE